MRGWVALFAIGLAALVPVKAAEVYSGVTHHFTIAPQDEEVLPPAEQGGTILADYSSTTAGSGNEEIKATANSNPPLQTGIYHIGLLVKTLDTEIAGTILATTEKGGTVQTFIVSTFENLDDEGWTRNFPASDLPGSTSGDFGGISFVDPAAWPWPRRRGACLRSPSGATNKVEPDRDLRDSADTQRDLKHFQFFPLFRRKVQGIGGRFELAPPQHIDFALDGTPRQNQPANRSFVRRVGRQCFSQRPSVVSGRLHQRPQSLRIVALHHHEGF